MRSVIPIRRAEQIKELKRLQKDNKRLRRAVFDLTLDKWILRTAASGNFSPLRAGGPALTMCAAR
jgi:hypothetical protein